MAVVQYTAIVNQIRGKLNGSVFNKNKTGYSLQRKQVSPNRRTASQLRRRADFAAVQRHWKSLSISQRSAAGLSSQNNPTVDRFGNEVVLSGYNHWVKANLMALLVGQPIFNAMVAGSAAGYQWTLESSVSQLSVLPSGGVRISSGYSAIGGPSNTQLVYIVGYISFPHSRGITNYSGRWLFLGALGKTSGTLPVGSYDIDFPESDPLDYPVDVEGQQVLLRVDIWNLLRGARISSLITPTSFV